MVRWVLRHRNSAEPYFRCRECTTVLCFLSDMHRRSRDAFGRMVYEFHRAYVANIDSRQMGFVQCWCAARLGNYIADRIQLTHYLLVSSTLPDHGFFDGAGPQNELVFNLEVFLDLRDVWKCGDCDRHLLYYPHVPNIYTRVLDLVNVHVNDRGFIFCRCGQFLGVGESMFITFDRNINIIRAYSLQRN